VRRRAERPVTSAEGCSLYVNCEDQPDAMMTMVPFDVAAFERRDHAE
jgi:hypothetical protein